MVVSMIIALMLVSFTCGENPAIQVVLTDKGLQYGKHVGAGWIQEKLEVVVFPDIGGSFSIGIGDIDYTLTGVRITKVDLPEPSVEFIQGPTGLKTSTSGLSIAVTGGWRTRFGVIHDGGTFDMALFNVDVTSVVELGKDPDGHMSVTSVNCDAEIGDIDVTFHGGASWLFEPFVKYFKGRIKGEVKDNICPNVEKYIADVEHGLQAMKVSFEVNEDLILDIPLISLPVIEDSSLNLGFKGEFYSNKTHQEPPFVAQPFVVPEKPGYMLSAGLSEFTMNSASYGYYSAGLLQAIINDSMIPPTSPVHLNTSLMGPFIPQLPKMFPGLLMTLQVYATEVPLLSFQPGAIKMGSMAAIKAFAIQPNSTQTPLFKLLVDSEFSSKVSITEGKLKGSMVMDNFTLSLDSSEVGTVKTDALENLAKMGITMELKKVNDQLAKGFAIPPMKHAKLVNPTLMMEEGFIAIFTDAELFEDTDFN